MHFNPLLLLHSPICTLLPDSWSSMPKFALSLYSVQPFNSYPFVTDEIWIPSPGSSELARYSLQQPLPLSKPGIVMFDATTLNLLDCAFLKPF